MEIEVNDKFVKCLNNIPQSNCVIQITSKIDDDVYGCKFVNSNQSFVATTDTIKTWVKQEDVVKNTTNVVKPKRKRNAIPLIQICLQVLKRDDVLSDGLTATEIYNIIKQENLFQFSENAKTPANTIHARIREYMKKNGAFSEIRYNTVGNVRKFKFDDFPF